MAKTITPIPATIPQFTNKNAKPGQKRRVAAYARVSTDMEEQLSSYQAQMDYYTKYIMARTDWEFAGLFSDEGISGTSTKYRTGFNRMIEDALAGKIDLIVTKSISRFARNTVDKGDALLQKKFTLDFLTKKQKINEGEVPQYYVTDSHEGIVSPEVFELVQYEYQHRREKGAYQSRSDSPFSGHVICGDCGAYYGRKVWHSNDKYRRLIWYCNKRYGKGEEEGLRCKTPHLTDDEIKAVFVGAMNAALSNKQEILDSCRTAVDFLTDTSKLEAELHALEAEQEVAAELLRKCVEENARMKISQEAYETKYTALAQKYEAVKGKFDSTNDKLLRRKLKANRIEAFFKTMETSDLITEFDDALWNATVDTMTVYSRDRIVLLLKDGTEIEWHA